MTPLEILLSSNRDEKSMQALSSGLRRRKEIAQLALLSGDEDVGNFGRGLYGDVEDKFQTRVTEREKKAHRDLTQGYYDQLSSQNALANTMANRRQIETERHNLAMENRAIPGSVTPKDIFRGVQKLSASLDRGGSMELKKAMDDVNVELTKYKEEGADIPGYGAGRLKPLFMLGEEGKALRTKVQAVTNILLKKRSGGAVTPHEAERLAKEFGATFGLSDKDFMNAWDDLTNRFDAGMANIFAGYSDEVVSAYKENMERQFSAGIEEPSGKTEAPGTGNAQWNDLE